MPSSRSRIIELTNGEAGIENREKVFLLDWMNTYKENQAKRGKKDGNQISVTIRILKDYAGERMTMDRIDKAFCQDYLDYLMTEYRPKGKRVSNFTLHTYYRILNFECRCSCGDYKGQSVYQNQ